ncbi:MAG: hypothetical protein FWD73_04545 [Polyangiaceae bacterium]|nr:hypothetical protein [Polyangiaceae bacterium]
MRFVSSIVYNAPIALASVLGIGACSTHGNTQSETQSGASDSVQPLTRDTECNVGVAAADDVLYSATHFGDADGILDLSHGETAIVFNSDGTHFDWSATTPIAVVIVSGDEWRADVFSYNPAATHGERLFPPRDPSNQDMQLPLSSIKFCFRHQSGTTDAGAAPEQDAAPPNEGNTW